MKKNTAGFMVMTAFMALAIMVALVTQYLLFSGTYIRYAYIFNEREKAKILARSGIAIALSQLSLCDKTMIKSWGKSNEEIAEKRKDPIQRQKYLLKVLLTVVNRWQVFECTEKNDGIEGTIKIAIVCEDGKLPLQALLNYEKREYVRLGNAKQKDGKEFLIDFFERYKKYADDQDLMPVFEEWFKKTGYYLIDVTQLMTIDGFKKIRNQLFFTPQEAIGDDTSEEKNEKKTKKRVFLTDAMTLEVETPMMCPFLFSESIKVLYDLCKGTRFFSQEQIDEIIENVSLQSISWQQVWDTYCKDVYGKDFKSLPEDFALLLSTKFEPKAFSVVCYAKAGRVEQKLVALITRNFTKQGEIFEIKRIYWL